MKNNPQTRRIILDLAVTLDGFIEGKNGEIDWCIMDPEMNFTDFLYQIDTILFGRKSYDLWKEMKTLADASEEDKEMANLTLEKTKYVFSRTKKLVMTESSSSTRTLRRKWSS